jgi:hypothetical protein
LGDELGFGFGEEGEEEGVGVISKVEVVRKKQGMGSVGKGDQGGG